MAAQRKSPTAGSFGEVQQIGLEDGPTTCNCVAEGFDNILPVVTAEHVLPTVALDMFPELRGTCWHRIGLKTACTAMARALLDDGRVSISFARAIARAVCCSGQVVALDGRVLVLSDERAVVIGDRSIYLLRCNDGG